MRYIVDKLPPKPIDCPFCVPSLYGRNYWCDFCQTECNRFNDASIELRPTCNGLVSLTGIISQCMK